MSCHDFNGELELAFVFCFAWSVWNIWLRREKKKRTFGVVPQILRKNDVVDRCSGEA
jgi:hypothetical protein